MNSKEFSNNVEKFIANAELCGIGQFLVVGADYETSLDAISIAENFQSVFASVGIHPHDAKKLEVDFMDQFGELLTSPRVVAIGETGLDYYYDHSPRDKQKEVFRKHIKAAKLTNLPLILHIRDAMPDALEILNDECSGATRGVFHCYAGGLEYLEKALELGYYLSFSGIITYAKSEELREVARVVPIEKILCETDSPWLSPKHFRGKINEPANVRFVYDAIADVRGITVDDLAAQVEINFSELFNV